MGLAASQARFLGLTARKSNVEYQGQQINQARTALSNEVMGLYQEYNNLSVPVPPSIDSFVKTTYKLNETYENYEIQSFSKITEGDWAGYYNVTLSYNDTTPKAYTYSAKDSVVTVRKDGDDYSYINFKLGLDSYTYDVNSPSTSDIEKITGDYEKYQGLSTIMNAQGLSDGVFYRFLKDGVSYYTSQNDLDSTAFEDVEGKTMYSGNYTFDYQGSFDIAKTINAKASLTQGANGRLSTINVLECDDDPSLVGNAYSITAGTEDDQLAYEDAMNKYYYEKQKYEHEVERINKKTAKIQAEDKSLELKLNQLDTEQNAISTEMESISKVIEKTIENVYKTFNS